MNTGHSARVRRLAAAILVVVAALCVPTGRSLAEETRPAVVHVVAWGETLSSIARAYDVSVSALMQANQLSDDRIYAGQQLVIPRAGGASSAQAGGMRHVVQQGETLFGIARRYGVSVEALKAANSLTDDTLYAGLELLIPAGGVSSGQAGAVHVVQPGETLYAIGQQYGVSVSALVAANNLVNASQIYAGQTLAIPGAATATTAGYTADQVSTTHVVQPGETLQGIAAYYGVSLWTLAQVNNISNPSMLYAGQVLTIPDGGALSAPSAPAANVGSKSIIVDVSEQRTYVYEYGQVQWVFVVSTGLPGADTWRGDFEIQNKIPMAYAASWDLQMPFWMGFYWAGPLQNGFHALPILSDGSRLWEGLLGQPASFGCVILSESDAALLYGWAEIGTPVRVQN